MGFLTDWLTDWLKELLIEGIMGNLTGLFDTVNTRVGEIAVQVGTTPAAWHAGVVPTCAAISPTWVLTVSKSPSRFPMIPPIRSSLSQFVSQSVRKSISAYLKTGQTAEGSAWCQ